MENEGNSFPFVVQPLARSNRRSSRVSGSSHAWQQDRPLEFRLWRGLLWAGHACGLQEGSGRISAQPEQTLSDYSVSSHCCGSYAGLTDGQNAGLRLGFKVLGANVADLIQSDCVHFSLRAAPASVVVGASPLWIFGWILDDLRNSKHHKESR